MDDLKGKFSELLGSDFDALVGKMQNKFESMQQDFSAIEIQGLAGIEDAEGLFVKVVITGDRKIKQLVIGDGIWKSGREACIELIIAAVNNATDKLAQEMQSRVKEVYEEGKEDKDA